MIPLRCAVRSRGFGMARLLLELARPYRRWLAVILASMLVETLAALAAPWPLKIVIDYSVGHLRMPAWAAAIVGPAIASIDQLFLTAVSRLLPRDRWRTFLITPAT